MAAVIGDCIAGPSRFHNMIVSPSIQHQHHHQHNQSHSLPQARDDAHRSASHSRNRSHDRPRASSSASRSQRHSSAAGQNSSSPPTHADRAPETASPLPTQPVNQSHVKVAGLHQTSSGGASRFPSPPASTSSTVSSGPAAADDVKGSAVSMEAQIGAPGFSGDSHNPSRSGQNDAGSTALPQQPQQQQPSPPSEHLNFSHTSYLTSDATLTPQPAQTVIHVRDLAHVQSLARSNTIPGGGSDLLNDQPQQMKYEISAMPIGDIIEMVAALLTKITTTNDLQHDAMSRNVTHQQQANLTSEGGTSSHMSPMSHSVLAFHGKNVPAITILSYLSRIHKYCPTTYEVFLSLLVYFDRMTERVNDLVTKSEAARRSAATQAKGSSVATQSQVTGPSQAQQDTKMRDDSDLVDSDESDSDLADDDDEDMTESTSQPSRREGGRVSSSAEEGLAVAGPATYFVVDSFNIHRLIIAGVTCSSKFFSDVFYTNSRYAKVGGLPLAELNHLELQFLVLNDFRLAVPVEDLEAYATMLVEFYAREVVSQRSASAIAE